MFGAENFFNAESKEKLEKYLTQDKKNLKLSDGCEQDETDIPINVREVIKDIEDVVSMKNVVKEKYRVCVMWLIIGLMQHPYRK